MVELLRGARVVAMVTEIQASNGKGLDESNQEAVTPSPQLWLGADGAYGRYTMAKSAHPASMAG